MRGIHRWPVNSQHNGPVTRKMFSSDDVNAIGDVSLDLSPFNAIVFCEVVWWTEGLFLSARCNCNGFQNWFVYSIHNRCVPLSAKRIVTHRKLEEGGDLRFIMNSDLSCEYCDKGGWMHVMDITGRTKCIGPLPSTPGPHLRYSTMTTKTMLLAADTGTFCFPKVCEIHRRQYSHD